MDPYGDNRRFTFTDIIAAKQVWRNNAFKSCAMCKQHHTLNEADLQVILPIHSCKLEWTAVGSLTVPILYSIYETYVAKSTGDIQQDVADPKSDIFLGMTGWALMPNIITEDDPDSKVCLQRWQFRVAPAKDEIIGRPLNLDGDLSFTTFDTSNRLKMMRQLWERTDWVLKEAVTAAGADLIERGIEEHGIEIELFRM